MKKIIHEDEAIECNTNDDNVDDDDDDETVDIPHTYGYDVGKGGMTRGSNKSN